MPAIHEFAISPIKNMDFCVPGRQKSSLSEQTTFMDNSHHQEINYISVFPDRRVPVTRFKRNPKAVKICAATYCREPLSYNQLSAVIANCFDWFHYECLTKLLRRVSGCPACYGKVDEVFVSQEIEALVTK